MQGAILNAGNFAMISSAPALILVVTFFFYSVVAGESMDAARVFTAILVFDRLRFPIIFYPQVRA